MSGSEKFLELLQQFGGVGEKLDPELLEAIQNFTLAWSLLEFKVLDCNASARRIADLREKLSVDQSNLTERIKCPASYFADRYVGEDGELQPVFDGLGWGRKPRTVEMGGETVTIKDFVGDELKQFQKKCGVTQSTIVAVLFIVWRLRNHLFHGVKWKSEFENQEENLWRATVFCFGILELSERHS